MNKEERHRKILDVISSNEITTQEELVEKLREEGVLVTQATVSRDIKELGVSKGKGLTKKYKYVVKQRIDSDKNVDLLSKFIKSCECSENIIVCKTHVGCAQTACAIVDSINFSDVIGSIAGDDCFMMVCKPFTSRDVCEKISAYIL